jgi:hypothetical protein
MARFKLNSNPVPKGIQTAHTNYHAPAGESIRFEGHSTDGTCKDFGRLRRCSNNRACLPNERRDHLVNLPRNRAVSGLCRCATSPLRPRNGWNDGDRRRSEEERGSLLARRNGYQKRFLQSQRRGVQTIRRDVATVRLAALSDSPNGLTIAYSDGIRHKLAGLSSLHHVRRAEARNRERSAAVHFGRRILRERVRPEADTAS